MQSKITLCALGLAVLVFAANKSAAQTCDKTFTNGASTGVWQTGGNWFPAAEPTATDHVCIPAGYSVLIDDASPNTAVAESIAIEATQTTRGILTIDFDRQLTISQNSVIDGTLNIYPRGGRLIITADLTITGDGGEIKGIAPVDSSQNPSAAITKTGSSPYPILTLTAANHSIPNVSGLLVHGRLLIDASLHNYSGRVEADNGELLLEGEYMTATKGVWAASAPITPAGILVVNNEVKGSGLWELTQQEDATIEIQADCPDLNGQVKLQKGLFRVREDFITTGKLTMQSILGSSPTIEVHPLALASFDN